jgi:hypothetical protein
MKYLFISLAVIVLVVIAFIKGISVGNTESAEMESPCAPESIAKANNPDARLSHCTDHDWDGTTLLKKRLREAANHSTEYGIVCQDDQIRFAILPSVIQPEVPVAATVPGLPRIAPPSEPIPAHK